jgi:hypothetical protein
MEIIMGSESKAPRLSQAEIEKLPKLEITDEERGMK